MLATLRTLAPFACVLAFMASVFLAVRARRRAAGRVRAPALPPPRALTPYEWLDRERKAFAARPFVTTIKWSMDGSDILEREVAHPFGRRRFQERRLWEGHALVSVLMLFEDGSDLPSMVASLTLPPQQASVHDQELRFIRMAGPLLTFTDAQGRFHAWRMRRSLGPPS